jgi:hypothetical protein
MKERCASTAGRLGGSNSGLVIAACRLQIIDPVSVALFDQSLEMVGKVAGVQIDPHDDGGVAMVRNAVMG